MRRDCTYTFAYFSSNVDLHLWRIVRLPGGQSYDLRSSIKDAGIRIAAYTARRSASGSWRSKI